MPNIIKTFLITTLLSCNATPSNSDTHYKIQAKATTQINHVASTSKVENSISFDTYCNARFGYCVDFPKGLIYPQPESENGDGRVFKNRKGEAILTVFGRNNSDSEFGHISLEQQFYDDLHGAEEENGNKERVINYQKLGNNFFVISGLKKGKVFYQKTIIKDEAFAFAILEYNESEKMIFDKISDRIFKSFKWLKQFDVVAISSSRYPSFSSGLTNIAKY